MQVIVVYFVIVLCRYLVVEDYGNKLNSSGGNQAGGNQMECHSRIVILTFSLNTVLYCRVVIPHHVYPTPPIPLGWV